MPKNKNLKLKLKVFTLTHDLKNDEHHFRCAITGIPGGEVMYMYDTIVLDSDYNEAEKRAHEYTYNAFARKLRVVLSQIE